MPRITIAVDGPGSAGKGTVAKGVARALGYQYIDTGAMYRAVALVCRHKGIAWNDDAACAAVAAELAFEFRWTGDVLHILVDGEDITSEIRQDGIGRGASDVSALPSVRKALLGLQRALGAEGGVVMDGRDIGTVVLPDSELKIYLDAELDERARRRHEELVRRGETVPVNQVRAGLAFRDKQDSEREVAPLKQADDALFVDSTALSAAQVVEKVLALARERGADV